MSKSLVEAGTHRSSMMNGRTRSPVEFPVGTSPPVIVIGLDCVTGLQTARIFAQRGVPVIGVATNPRHPCCRTRACDRVIAADTSGPALIEALTSLGPTLAEAGVLVPCTDLSVLLTSRNRRALEPWYHLALPAEEVVEMLVDKAAFADFALAEGLPIPTTFVLAERQDAEAAGRALRFPAVLKPGIKSAAWSLNAGAKAFRVSDSEEMLRLYDRCAPWADRLIVQEWIEGTDTEQYTCNCYFSAQTEPLVTFTTRKLRQWPPFGGEACLSEESRDEVVPREAVRLFRAAGHHGLGYLEMKRSSRTGEYLIVEPNIGRPTGRSASAEAAGVELLYTMYCDLLGRRLPWRRVQEYRGLKWIHLRRDFQSALFRWWHDELTIREWLRSLRGPMVEAQFSWRDPAPFYADLVRVLVEAVRRRGISRRSDRAR